MCSLLLFLLISAYTLQKLDILIYGRDVDLIFSHKSNALTIKDEFDVSMGLNFAAAFTAYDDNVDPIDDPTVGEVVFNHHKWGRYDNGTVYFGRHRINSHRCTREELGLSLSTE